MKSNPTLKKRITLLAVCVIAFAILVVIFFSPVPIYFSSGKKLVLLPGQDKIISLKNGPRIFARKDPWPKKTDEECQRAANQKG